MLTNDFFISPFPCVRASVALRVIYEKCWGMYVLVGNSIYAVKSATTYNNTSIFSIFRVRVCVCVCQV